jgi:hypothetical protein
MERLGSENGGTIEPEGEKLTMQSMKVGPVWSRFDVTVVLSAQGMYLALEPRLMPKLWVWRPLQAIRKRPPVHPVVRVQGAA